MIPPKQVKAAADVFIDEVGGALRDVVRRLPDLDTANTERDAADDAFALSAALVDLAGEPRDEQLWGVIFAFGRWRPDGLMRALPTDLRRSGLLHGRAIWLDRPSQLFDVLVEADRRFGTTHSRTYYDRALHLAFTIAALEAAPTRRELGAIDRFRTMLLDRMADHASPLADGTRSSRHRSPTDRSPTDRSPADRTSTTGPTAAGNRNGADDGADDAPEADEPPPARPIEELLAELDALIGLDSVKTEVRLVTNLLRVQQLRAERGLPTTPQSRHLVFTGNPGTGKTTVARLLAEIYRSLGIVKRGQLVETDRSGLVSGYVGQTATRVMEAADRAAGGVLLVDEAYALARGGPNDFGREAIDTLVKVMEDRRDDLVVIAAGYPDEMADFIGANPGLSSRFPKTILFPDYDDDELWAIFHQHAERAGYRTNDEAEEKARSWFGAAPRDKGFGNGRLARNLFEDAMARQAGRIVTIDDPTDDELQTLTADDIADIGSGPRHGATAPTPPDDPPITTTDPENPENPDRTG